MRLNGTEYLKQALLDIIRQIAAASAKKKTSLCELDPFRLDGIKPDKKDKILQRNLKNLKQYVLQIITSIKDVTARFCPHHFRNIFDSIKMKIDSKFKDEIARYRAVGGFIFLRFFCPALISPKNYDLIDEQPDTDFARDLTLIAKTVQNIANLIEFSSVKEPFMEPINTFVTSHFDFMKQLLDEICTPLEKPIDSPPPTYTLNFGREMSRVHYHIQTLLHPLKEKFGDNEDFQNLSFQIERINEDTNRILTEEENHENNTNNQGLTIVIPNNNIQPPNNQTNNNFTIQLNPNQKTPTQSPNQTNNQGLILQLKGNQTTPQNNQINN